MEIQVRIRCNFTQVDINTNPVLKASSTCIKIGQVYNQLWLTNWLTNSLTVRAIDRLTIDHLTSWKADRLTSWPTDWLTSWVTEWVLNKICILQNFSQIWRMTCHYLHFSQLYSFWVLISFAVRVRKSCASRKDNYWSWHLKAVGYSQTFTLSFKYLWVPPNSPKTRPAFTI